MKIIKNYLRWLIPAGLLERHRRAFRLQRLGLPDSPYMESAVDACSYDLWPVSIRNGSTPGTLVDVGANKGEFITAASILMNWQSIYAFEPQPECRKALQIALGNVIDSHLYQVAVGDIESEIEFESTANSKLASVLSPDIRVAGEYPQGDFDVVRRIRVPLMRLDDVIPEDIDIKLLKIDVQGFELAVLAGAANTLQRTGALLVEMNYVAHYQSGSTFDSVYMAITAQGFKLYGISAPYSGKGGPLWADAMFVKNSIS